MKRYVSAFILAFSVVFIGCGSGDTSQISDPGTPSIQQEGDKPAVQTGPYTTAGEYGTLKLSRDFKLPEDALFIDIRNAWERQNWQDTGENRLENPSIPLGSMGGAVYEYRDPNGQHPRRVREEFVEEVSNLANHNKHRHIILICHSSSRTKKAAKLLSENGYTYIEQIEGGVEAWQQYGLPIAHVNEIVPDGSYVIPSNAIFIDIRNAWERQEYGYAEGSVYGAVYEYRDPNGQHPRRVRKEFVGEVLQMAKGDRHKKIILICHSSSRTTKATKLLAENGFTDVSHIKGGLEAWMAAGLPTR